MRKILIVPILIIGIGIGWLLNAMEIFPVMDWLWSILLGLTGVLIIAFGGKNSMTLLLGPSFLVGCLFSVLRQLSVLDVKYEVPTLMIAFGVIWLIVTLLKLPPPEWVLRAREENQRKP